MRKLQLVFFLLFLLFAGTYSQNFQGGLLKHIETGILHATPIDEDTIERPLIDFSTAFSRSDAFDSTDDETFIGTSLRDFHFESPLSAPTGEEVVHIQILNPRLNPSKNILTVTIKTDPTVVNNIYYRIKIYEVRLNYIVIGSGFQGFYDSSNLHSSYVFARNGNMDLYTGSNNYIDQPYDFHNPQHPSPFNYGYDPAVNVGCGAVKRDGKWIIQFGVQCRYIRLSVSITGFEIPNSDGVGIPTSILPGGAGNIFAGAHMNFKGQYTSQSDFNNDVINADGTKDGLLVSNELPSYLAGVPGGIAFHRIQLSLTVVALKQYNRASYPTQLVHPNTFKFNMIDANNYDFYSVQPSFAPLTRADLPYLMFFMNPSETKTFNIDGYAERIESDGFYFPTSASEVSHLYCGDHGFYFGSLTDVTTRYKIDVKFEDVNVDYNSGFALRTRVVKGGSSDFCMVKSQNCFMFTSTSSTVCEEKEAALPVDRSIAMQVTADNGNEGKDYFTNSPPAAYLYGPNYDPNYLENLSEKLIVEQSFIAGGTIKYQFSYEGVDANKVYEGILHVSSANLLMTPSNGYYKHTIEIEVFGNTVYRETEELNYNAKTIHFAFINKANSNSKVIITFQAHFDIAVTYTSYLEFALVEHSAVLTEQGECAATCDQVDDKSLGVDFSSVPPRCVACDTELNIIFRPELGKCGCGDGYVSINGICQVCGINLCSRCSPSKNQCEMCTSNAVYKDSADTSQGCECIAHYYQSDLECKQCPVGCVDCTNPTSCSACVSNSNTRTSEDKGCACLPGFYETGASVCPNCAPECKTCEEVSTKCTSCATENKFQSQGTTCICEPGYFKVIKDDGTATCQPCASYCSKCVDKADNCQECKPFRVRGSDNKCVCKSGYLQYQGECIDTLCSAIPYCQSCSILMSDGSSICNVCTGNRVPSQDKKQCQCKAGYFDRAGKCEKCGEGCKKCKSETECEECADQAYPVGDGTCNCPGSNFIAHIGNSLICQLCDANCRKCTGSPSNCQECQNGFVSVSNKCICPPGYYPTLDQFQCIQCGTGCSSCTSGDKCDTCEPGYTPSDSNCVLNCPTGTFNAGDKCKKCSKQCSHCTSSIQCSGCFTGYKLFAGSCRETCPAGTFQRGSLCLACKEPCATCNVNADSCLTCISGYFPYQGQCISDCPSRSYYDGQTCQPCNFNCENCFESANNCISCLSDKYLVDGQCQQSCPYTIVDGKCSDNCPPKYYLSGNTCRQCKGECETCSSGSACLTCKNDLLVYKGNCIQKCPQNTMQLDKYCVDCDPSCIGCSENPFSCYKCRNGYYQLEERCYKQCPDGFYPDQRIGACKQCDAECQLCRGPGQCIQCQNGMNPVSGICPNSCGANCISCEEGTCDKCSEGYIVSEGKCQSYCPSGATVQNGNCVCNTGYIHNNRCVTKCPSGFAGEGNNCVPCKKPCETCDQSINQCQTCIQGFKLDQVTKRCVNNLNCPYGYYGSTLGGCQHICEDGWYYHDSACYEDGCPVGYSPNEQSRSCTQQDIPSGCSFPYYLQGSTCVSNCGPGFYANQLNRVCEPCPPNCYTCNENKICEGCISGFVPQGNICVASVKCPDGYHKYEQLCVRQCPVGTSQQNGYCVRICRAGSYFYLEGCYSMCPTNYRTHEACVNTCPANYLLENKVCYPPKKDCPLSQYYDSNSNTCLNCRLPCSACQGAANRCTDCIQNYYLSNNQCLPNSGLNCPQKCASCQEPNKCSSCASGYVNTGSDCVKNTNVLKSVSFQEISKTIRNRTVFIKIKPSILPNNLPSSIASNFFIFSPTVAVQPIINQWISGSDIYVALTHPTSIPSYSAYLVPNAEILNNFYLNMGYRLLDAYVQVDISPNLQSAPANLAIPAISSAISFSKNTQNKRMYSLSLNAVVARAVRF